MIDETTAGPAAISASHWASKSGLAVSPASAAGAGPHCDRNSRTPASATASRVGSGSGIHRFSWKAPLLPARTRAAQSAIPLASDSTPPMAPIPPALATATASSGGQAPAIGASRIGNCRPNRSQKAWARARGAVAMSFSILSRGGAPAM